MLFRQGKYEEARKTYDRAFFYIYSSKEEWEALGPEGRKDINQFKLPCHLNRGLCRLRCSDFKNAHWDFSEALSIDPENVKGFYPRRLTQLRMCQGEVAKEEKGEWWDLEKVEQQAEESRKDLYRACRSVPRDMDIRQAIKELKALREELAVHRKNYNADRRKLYSLFVANLDKDNRRKQRIEDEDLFKDMPDVERIRIE